MLKIFDRISFWALSLVLILTPFFFLPFSKVPAEISKGALLVIGVSVSVIFWAAARFFDGRINFSKSLIFFASILVVLVSLLSAVFSQAFNFSVFGVMFDIGSFGVLLSVFILMFLSSSFLKDEKNRKIVLFGFTIASFFTLLVQFVNVVTVRFFDFNILLSSMNNLIGSFNSLAIFAGLSILLAILAFSFYVLPKYIKYIFAFNILFSVFFLMILNFSFAWILLGVFAFFFFIYQMSISASASPENKRVRKFAFLSFLIVLLSLFFILGNKNFGNILPNYFGISNIETRPSVVSTFSVAKNALMQDPILGMGMNTFSLSWDAFKPGDINYTAFWNSTFEVGFGLIPTYMISAGFLGIISWLLFLSLVLISGFKTIFLNNSEENKKIKIMFLLLALYLLFSAFFYSISITLLILLFGFLGIFIGLKQKEKNSISMTFLNDPRKSFLIIVLLTVIILGTVTVCFKYTQRISSIHNFQKAISAESIESAKLNINKAVRLYPNDLYFRTYTQVYLVDFKNISSKGETMSDNDKAVLKDDFDKIIQSGQLAINFNKNNYFNYKSLGLAYEVLSAFGIENALSASVDMYKKAAELNPQDPSLKLDIARLYFSGKNNAEAKNYAQQAFNLKNDYIDAMILLSQIFKSEGDTKSASMYAQLAVSYYPTNSQLSQYADSLLMQEEIKKPEAKE